jgi:uncharacterized membrane protein YhiD involved in acid resistance
MIRTLCFLIVLVLTACVSARPESKPLVKDYIMVVHAKDSEGIMALILSRVKSVTAVKEIVVDRKENGQIQVKLRVEWESDWNEDKLLETLANVPDVMSSTLYRESH